MKCPICTPRLAWRPASEVTCGGYHWVISPRGRVWIEELVTVLRNDEPTRILDKRGEPLSTYQGCYFSGPIWLEAGSLPRSAS